MIGKKFGKLTVISMHHKDSKNTFWNCLCDCGKMTVALQSQLRCGRRFTCGCTRRRKNTIATIKERKTRTFISWQSMLSRCTNPNAPDYPRYGGKGVTVCFQWSKNYEQFKHDMGERPAGTTLDRIDPSGNYEPSNCRWATTREQSLNKRNTKFYEVFGRYMTRQEVLDTYKLSPKKFSYWLKKGKSVMEVILGQTSNR